MFSFQDMLQSCFLFSFQGQKVQIPSLQHCARKCEIKAGSTSITLIIIIIHCTCNSNKTDVFRNFQNVYGYDFKYKRFHNAFFHTPPQNRVRVIFSFQFFLCMSVCLSAINQNGCTNFYEVSDGPLANDIRLIINADIPNNQECLTKF